MVLFNDKRDIFNQISVLNSLKNDNIIPQNIFNSFSSISNDRDVVSFLMELIVSLSGTDSIENIFSGLFTKYIKTYELKTPDIFIKEFIDYDSTNDLPIEFKDDGYNIELSSIDTYGIFKFNKIDPYSSLVYDEEENSFNNKIYQAINTPQVPIEYNNILLNYNSGILNIKPKSGVTIRDFIYSYIYGFTKINQKRIIAEIFDGIFGTLMKNNKFTKNQIKNKEELALIIKKIINDDDLDFTDNEIIKLNNNIENLYNQVNEIDLGCGFIQNNLTIEQLFEFSINIDDNNITEFEEKLNNFIVDNINTDADIEQKNNIKNNLIKRLINLFKEILIRELFLSPEKKLLFLIFNKFKNINFTNDFDFINNNINTIKCLKIDIDSDINEFIFNYVKNLLIDLVKPIALEILKENVRNYTNIIRSLGF
jgi:hypothetical protein